MRNNGSPLPEFETNDDRVSFLVRFPVHPGAARLASGKEGEQADGQVTPEVTPQVTPQVEEAILRLCTQPRSAVEIQKQVGLRDRKHLQTAYLRPMLGPGRRPDRAESRAR
jgi:ATP-dependent DNA helicase RecG